MFGFQAQVTGLVKCQNQKDFDWDKKTANKSQPWTTKKDPKNRRNYAIFSQCVLTNHKMVLKCKGIIYNPQLICYSSWAKT